MNKKNKDRLRTRVRPSLCVFLALAIAFASAVAMFISGCARNGVSESEEESGTAVTELSTEIEISNGNSQKSTQSIIYMESGECTRQFLAEWFFEKVEKKKCDTYFIVYTDQIGKGVFSAGGYIDRDCDIELQEDGSYMEIGIGTSETLYPRGNGTLK